MATDWIAELNKKEHKNWVMVGGALNITRKGITPLIQRQMEAWYQSLISSSPLRSLPLCTCEGHSSKCATCNTWKKELERLHKSSRPKICWNNSDRQKWGSRTEVWEIAKVFMPTLGTQKGDIIDANTTDIGGLLNLLEWCPFIHPSVNQVVLNAVRDMGRNKWAHSPNQELQDADVSTIFGLLNNLLSDPVFKEQEAAQKSLENLQELVYHGLVNVRDSEIEALHLLRQSLVADLISSKDDSSELKIQIKEVADQLAEMDAEVYAVRRTLDLDTTKEKITNLEANFESMKSELETLKAKSSVGQSEEDIATLCAAPRQLLEFTGREAALEWLEHNFVSDKESSKFSGISCCTKTICGLGGCGKTSLAVQFAWRWKSHFNGGVFWINGESDTNVRKSVAENLALLNIPASTSENVDDFLNRFLAQLSNKDRPWLLVVDNADELTSLECPSGVMKICNGPWQTNAKAPKNGHILFTTRQNARDVKMLLKLSLKDCWELQSFTKEEGALFLMKRTGLEGESLYKEAIDLAEELGGLPLALEQAAAHISALPIPCTFKAYLDKYQKIRRYLLEQHPLAALRVEAQHRLSVYTTWQMNFESVAEKSPAAATMMHIASFLESENIPFEVINHGLPTLDQVELREAASSDISGVLKVLTRYSLFSVNQESKVFSVHKLVQEVIRESLDTRIREKILIAAMRVLNCALIKKSESCLNLNDRHVINWLEVSKEDRNTLFALFLNYLKLEDHLRAEMNLLNNHFKHCILIDDTYRQLLSITSQLLKADIYLARLKDESLQLISQIQKK